MKLKLILFAILIAGQHSFAQEKNEKITKESIEERFNKMENDIDELKRKIEKTKPVILLIPNSGRKMGEMSEAFAEGMDDFAKGMENFGKEMESFGEEMENFARNMEEEHNNKHQETAPKEEKE